MIKDANPEMRRDLSTPSRIQPSVSLRRDVLQRKCDCGNHTIAGGGCNGCNKKRGANLQRSAIDPDHAKSHDNGVPPIVREVLNSQGQPLDAQTRAFFEPRFAHDFSGVRVHADAKAAESAQAVNALAYTVGSDVVLGKGQDVSATSAGRQLLAHELTHVMQQGGSARGLQPNSKLGEENDRYEQEAEQSAAQCMNGTRVKIPSMISSALVQRTKICSKRLDNPLGVLFNHSYIDDTGNDNCLGKSQLGNYAIQSLSSGNFLNGCAIKTPTSTDPQDYTPNVKQCDPKPGVKDLSRCLLDTFASYPNPSVYKNPFGPNSNTFAATLAKTCCADGSSSGLGWVPGWRHAPAQPCQQQPQVYVAGGEQASEEGTSS
jgi:hypothetical protein